MADLEDKQRAFVLSLVAAYSENLYYFQQVLDVLGSYTGDCSQTLHTMGSTLFQQNPALLEQFFCLYPWARHPDGGGPKDKRTVKHSEESGAKDDPSVKSGVKDDQSVKDSEESGLKVDKISSLKNLSPKKLKLKMSDVSLCSSVNANIVVDSDITCGNRSDTKFDNTSITDLKTGNTSITDLKTDNTSKPDLKTDNTSKTDTPLRRSSRVAKVPAGGYKNDLSEDVLFQVSQLKPQLQTPEISDSSDDFEDDYNFEKSYERDIMESENDHHEDNTNSQKTERISCTQCQSHFKTKKYLREHIRLLKCRPIVKTEILSCSKCQKQFKAKKYLRTHIRQQTCRPRPIVKTFQCPKCNKSFRKEGYLTQHTNLKHRNQNVNCTEKCDRPSSSPQFQCQKCNRSFYNKGHLTQHTNKKVKCDIVKKLFDKPKTYKTSNSQLEINTSTSAVGDDHESQEIVTEKARNDELGKEIKCERQDDNSTKKCVKLSENEFQCSQCEMVFATIRKLRWHRMKVHDSDPCICQYCSKTFATKETLSKHVCKIDPLLIKCDVCDTSFEDALELSVHLKTAHSRVCESHSQIDTEGCFDQSFFEASLEGKAEDRGNRIDTLETNWENIREAVWEEEWEKSRQVMCALDSME